MKSHMQIAADLVGDLADAVGDLGRLLDRIHATVDPGIWSQVEREFPIHTQLASSGLVRLMHRLTPPDDYDPADERLLP